MPTIALDDLLIPETDQAAITRALANTGNSDPWTPALAQVVDLVNTFTAKYTLTSSHYIRLVRPLVIWTVYGLANSVTPAMEAAYKAAMEELKDIRDGKFSETLVAASPTSATARQGSHGSEERVPMRTSTL